MRLKKALRQLGSVVLASALVLGLAGCKGNGDGGDEAATVNLEKPVTISLWYDDDSYTSYFQDCANRYHESNEQVTVELKLVDTDDYLNSVYEGCVKSDNGADIFLTSSVDIQKTWLMGLDRENSAYGSVYSSEHYPDKALEAASYKDKLYGYPLTFNTSVMVYNKQFATSMNTFADITSYSDNFEHTEENAQVEQVIQWDVSSAKLNYALLGAYMNVGGDKADDKESTSLQDDKLKECLEAYVALQESYGIVRNTCTYENCLTQFKEGKLLYTIVDSNDLAGIEASGVQFGIQQIPDFNQNLKTRAMSTTQMLMVTPYSANAKVAESVARTFTFDYADKLKESTGLAAARSDVNTDDEHSVALRGVYAQTSLRARYMDIGDFYIRLEIMLHQVWDGTVTVEEGYGTFKGYVLGNAG
jgi:maltose-binding protein MalE